MLCWFYFVKLKFLFYLLIYINIFVLSEALKSCYSFFFVLVLTNGTVTGLRKASVSPSLHSFNKVSSGLYAVFYIQINLKSPLSLMASVFKLSVANSGSSENNQIRPKTSSGKLNESGHNIKPRELHCGVMVVNI